MHRIARDPVARASASARSIAAGFLKTPKTVEPLPVIAAATAPAASRRSLISPMGGHSARAYGSRSFPARTQVSTSLTRLPFRVGLKSPMLLIFKAGVNDAEAAA